VKIAVVRGGITRLDVQAIVTAANTALRGGGGVDAAVHAAAGPQLLQASLALAPCPAAADGSGPRTFFASPSSQLRLRRCPGRLLRSTTGR
jgi:hypothetical protein